MCDIHALVGAYRHRLFGLDIATSTWDHLPPFYLWVMDYDIAWAGDLGALVDAFAGEGADLLVAKAHGQAISKVNHKGQITYAQFRVRNYLADGDVYSALLAPVRYSRRMLDETRRLLDSGKLSFCETRGPSLCHQHASWCRQRSMLDLRPDLFSANFSCCKSYSERFARERSQLWREIPEASRPPVQMLHRVKLDLGGAARESMKARYTRHANKTHPHPHHASVSDKQ